MGRGDVVQSFSRRRWGIFDRGGLALRTLGVHLRCLRASVVPLPSVRSSLRITTIPSLLVSRPGIVWLLLWHRNRAVLLKSPEVAPYGCSVTQTSMRPQAIGNKRVDDHGDAHDEISQEKGANHLLQGSNFVATSLGAPTNRSSNQLDLYKHSFNQYVQCNALLSHLSEAAESIAGKLAMFTRSSLPFMLHHHHSTTDHNPSQGIISLTVLFCPHVVAT